MFQSDDARESLTERLIGTEMSVPFFLAWRKDQARLAAYKAALWQPIPSDSVPGHSEAATGPASVSGISSKASIIQTVLQLQR